MSIVSAPHSAGGPPTGELAFAAMVRALRALGEKVRLRDAWALLNDGLGFTRPLITDYSEAGMCKIQVMVPALVPLAERHTMFSVSHGEGATFNEAVEAATSSWIATAMPMFRAAMANTDGLRAGGGYKVDVPHVGCVELMRVASATSVDRFVLQRVSEVDRAADTWNAFVSAIAFQGNPDGFSSLTEHLVHLPPLAVLLRPLHEALTVAAVHHLQLIVTLRPDRSLILICLLDNENWAAGKSALHDAYQLPYPWPESDSEYGFRQYIVLRPTSGKAE